MARNIPVRLKLVSKILNQQELLDVGYESYKKHTPYRSGNAKRNTKKSYNEIIADYAYAKRLEDGWSNQAPDGMTIPTIEDIRKYVQQKLGVKI